LLPFDKKRITIVSQIDRPFVAQTTVLKHHRPRLRPVAAIVHINKFRLTK